MARYRIPAGGLQWDGAEEGDLLIGIATADGRVVFLPLHRPDDYDAQEDAGTPYALFLIGGLPAWRATALDVIGSGYGNNYGSDYGGPEA